MIVPSTTNISTNRIHKHLSIHLRIIIISCLSTQALIIWSICSTWPTTTWGPWTSWTSRLISSSRLISWRRIWRDSSLWWRRHISRTTIRILRGSRLTRNRSKFSSCTEKFSVQVHALIRSSLFTENINIL